MARKSLRVQVLEEEKRVRSILDGLFNVSDPMPQQLVLQALQGLDRIRELCYGADTDPTPMASVAMAYDPKLLKEHETAAAAAAAAGPSPRARVSRKAG